MKKILNIKIASNCFASLILLLVGVYVFQIGSLTREKYQIKSYKSSIFNLSEHNKALSIDFSKASSLNNIDGHLSSNNFIKPINVNYVEILDSSVVARNQWKYGKLI